MIIAYRCVCGLLVSPGRVCPCGEVMLSSEDEAALRMDAQQVRAGVMEPARWRVVSIDRGKPLVDYAAFTTTEGNHFSRGEWRFKPTPQDWAEAEWANVTVQPDPPKPVRRVYMPCWVEWLLKLVGFSAAALVLAVALAGWWSR